MLSARPPETLVAESYASSCLIMFQCKLSVVVKGIGNIMFIEQGFPLLLCTW